MATKMEQIKETIRTLKENLEGEIFGVAVGSMDGRIIESLSDSSKVNMTRVVASVALMLKSAKKVERQTNMGKPENMLIGFKDGQIIVESINDKVFLAVISKKDANIGFIELEVDEAINSLKEILGG
ncbi:roadblock/LC7 domain-containing protein [Desulfurobacterium sp.]|uniref:roadblock/LC7 domain-containing protein n=1 Tax=Desulfurobacterium sp. TaxID=2004706 RepID=UPI002626AC8C|nr:roadblock/LC7 domain-containing protein [Desulfurobacterium sp.]